MFTLNHPLPHSQVRSISLFPSNHNLEAFKKCTTCHGTSDRPGEELFRYILIRKSTENLFQPLDYQFQRLEYSNAPKGNKHTVSTMMPVI